MFDKIDNALKQGMWCVITGAFGLADLVLGHPKADIKRPPAYTGGSTHEGAAETFQEVFWHDDQEEVR